MLGSDSKAESVSKRHRRTLKDTDTIRLRAELLEQVVGHARDDEPTVACGVIHAVDGVPVSTHRVTNAAASWYRYEFAPLEQLALEEQRSERGETLYAIYSSRITGDAYPSTTDISSAFWPFGNTGGPLLYPDTLYLFVGLEQKPPAVRAFKILPGGQVSEEVVEIDLSASSAVDQADIEAPLRGALASIDLDLRLVGDQNPFAVLGLELDVDSRAVRRRLEELELSTRLGGQSDADHDVIDLRQAAARLTEPEQRLFCELLAPWAGSLAYGHLAARHDEALQSLRMITSRFDSPKGEGRPTRAPSGESKLDKVVSCIAEWNLVVEDASVAIAERRSSLGLLGDSWLEQFVSTALSPALVRRIRSELSADEVASLVDSLSDSPSGIDPETALALADRLIELSPEVQSVGAVPRMLEHLEAVAIAADALDRRHPRLSGNLRAHAAVVANKAAGAIFDPEGAEPAERLLVALLRHQLAEADRLESEENLKAIRFARYHSEAVRLAKGGQWDRCVEALRSALGYALSEEAKAQIRSEIATAEEARQRTEQKGLSGGAIVWLVIAAVVVVAVIAGQVNENGSGGSSGGSTRSTSASSGSFTSSPSASAGATSQATGAPTARATPRPPSSSVAYGQLVDAWNSFIEAEDRIPVDEESTLFSSRARQGANSARSMATTARSLRASVGAQAACADAMAAVGDLGYRMWNGLSQATAGIAIDVGLWNSTLDSYQSRYNQSAQTVKRVCP